MASIAGHRRARATALAAGLLVTALAAGGATAVAGAPTPPPPDSSSGNTGRFTLTDTDADPAGRCVYGKTVDGTYYNWLDRLGSRAPKVYARRGKTSQRVSWRLVVQAWDGGAWVRAERTDWVTRTATPTRAAPFGALDHHVASLRDAATRLAYRAKAQVRWFASDGVTVVGRADLWPDHYRLIEGGPLGVSPDYCGTSTG
jgi:hypothetical protein